MMSISNAVEELVIHKPYLSESLASGIINVSALARQLQPEIQKMIQKEVNIGAIVMSLNRLGPYLQVREQVQLNKLLSTMGDIILRSNLCDYTFKNSPTLLECHIEMLKELVKNEEVFYTLVQGVFETNLVVSDIMSGVIEKFFKNEQCLFKQNNLSSVTLKLPKGNTMQPGFYYSIMKELSWEGINLMEVISSTNEFTVVVDNSLIDKTFIVLKNIGKRVAI
ncbi:aspartate kinase [Odoribacter sp. OttesenSCG-928-J03]|nr:aspartate kinase [Odoribacter sp. OttesenSCG-928-J03]MDL2282917.1 aspartate kinase [Odoribacter sp. OttesenSCG-928-G04]MDL2330883.1 aspartate kinase [Odoribacter sp. OttesenSCG-928-A06]